MSAPAKPIVSTSVPTTKAGARLIPIQDNPQSCGLGAPAFRITTVEERIAALPWPLRALFRLSSYLLSTDSSEKNPSHQ